MENYYYRTIDTAKYIVRHKTTIRQTAKVFNMAKSTLHYDLQNRLPFIDEELYFKVNKILQFNFNEKHIRGGEA
ncbi:MAG: sporulation transcriptional regulator SpoIIID, partial [Clostridiales bacterium]|nr:sporulation transcriptional regulator SpoIIID [Candidatus Apopatousia equi]